MKPASAKNKGRMLQKWVRDTILRAFPVLSSDDVRSTSMGASGEDILLSSLAKSLFPYAVECKNVESLNVWAAFSQCQANASSSTTPLLFIKKNKKNPLVVMPADIFFSLISADHDK